MALVTLDRMWLHEASDLSDVLTFRQVEWSEKQDRDAEVRVYAGGRRRLVGSPGASHQLMVTIPWMDRDSFLALLDRSGRMQMLRDGRRRRMWGMVSDVTGAELRAYDTLRSVGFTFTQVTMSEVV